MKGAPLCLLLSPGSLGRARLFWGQFFSGAQPSQYGIDAITNAFFGLSYKRRALAVFFHPPNPKGLSGNTQPSGKLLGIQKGVSSKLNRAIWGWGRCGG